jgi:hypothetical protein
MVKKTTKKTTKKAARKDAPKNLHEALDKKPRMMAKTDYDLKSTANKDMPAAVKHSTRTQAINMEKFVEGHGRVTIVGRDSLLSGAVPARVLQEIENKHAEKNGWPLPWPEVAQMPPATPSEQCLAHAHICKGKAMLSWLHKNLYGFSAIGLKKSMASAAFGCKISKDKISIIKNIFVHGPYDGLIAITEPDMKTPKIYVERTDAGISAKGNLVVPIYRPEFKAPWCMQVHFSWVEGIMNFPTILNILEAAGRFNGRGPWRHEKSGTFGSFDVLVDTAEILPALPSMKSLRL